MFRQLAALLLPVVLLSPGLATAQSRVKVPDVEGLMLNQARRDLLYAGLDPEKLRVSSHHPRYTVLTQRPEAGRPIGHGRTVLLTYSYGWCHTSYRFACLRPDASDYDCAGSGDGPFFVEGTVAVVGPDVFELNTDTDDFACGPGDV
jgi:PASTA domain